MGDEKAPQLAFEGFAVGDEGIPFSQFSDHARSLIVAGGDATRGVGMGTLPVFVRIGHQPAQLSLALPPACSSLRACFGFAFLPDRGG